MGLGFEQKSLSTKGPTVGNRVIAEPRRPDRRCRPHLQDAHRSDRILIDHQDGDDFLDGGHRLTYRIFSISCSRIITREVIKIDVE